MSTTIPEVLSYQPGQRFADVSDPPRRQVGFTPFVPPTVEYAPKKYRLQYLSEFQAYYTALIAALPNCDAAWVAQALSEDASGETVVTSAGFIYRDSNTYGIWTGSNYTMWWWTTRQNTSPDWLTHPDYRSPT